MLNVMLMRDVESAIFDKTRRWLESDPENRFTLVVDELHSYRGTQGTEVALVVRNMQDRLGLAHDSRQLSCIATSASLDGDSGLEYLEQFFGVDRSTFAIYLGRPLVFNQRLPIEPSTVEMEAHALREGDTETARQAAFRLAQTCSPRELLASACNLAGKTSVKIEGEAGPVEIVRPAKLTAIKNALFGEVASMELLDALMIAARHEDRGGWDAPKPTFRSHMFLRQVQGIWACSNPGCTELEPRFRSPGRAIGRLFRSPALIPAAR